jgi:hypothetical protein
LEWPGDVLDHDAHGVLRGLAADVGGRVDLVEESDDVELRQPAVGVEAGDVVGELLLLLVPGGW